MSTSAACPVSRELSVQGRAGQGRAEWLFLAFPGDTGACGSLRADPDESIFPMKRHQAASGHPSSDGLASTYRSLSHADMARLDTTPQSCIIVHAQRKIRPSCNLTHAGPRSLQNCIIAQAVSAHPLQEKGCSTLDAEGD